MEKNSRTSSVNNINLLDLENNYSYSTPSSTYNSDSSSTTIVNNVEIDQNNLSFNDHAHFQYYINTISHQGWRVELQLWKALPDKVKLMVMEAKREAQKNQSSSFSPPKTTP